ncbi:hypothetical protein BDW42DRAFT_35893 [Aspergillus taichungensis]|uniref:Uncharacterized protein n=1 Tax=Aspergillus taichungensis TaxID=482145 RepID=A0A2J5I3Y3_9EURO|nr:hypothetical protein BDW42DRAFT_35893 [Aspergillus taichungensis]
MDAFVRSSWESLPPHCEVLVSFRYDHHARISHVWSQVDVLDSPSGFTHGEDPPKEPCSQSAGWSKVRQKDGWMAGPWHAVLVLTWPYYNGGSPSSSMLLRPWIQSIASEPCHRKKKMIQDSGVGEADLVHKWHPGYTDGRLSSSTYASDNSCRRKDRGSDCFLAVVLTTDVGSLMPCLPSLSHPRGTDRLLSLSCTLTIGRSSSPYYSSLNWTIQ